MMIAVIAEVNGCIVVSDNERHFPGIAVLNPLQGE
jgi:predicted nucleic acid-binding protein